MENATVSFACAACGKKFTAPARFAGRTATCPGCGAGVTVPGVPAKADPYADLIGFGCRLCGTRLYAPPRHVGRRMKCPDCDTMTVVPPAPPPPKSRRPAAMDGESYEVYEGEQPRGVDLARAAPRMVSFVCERCNSHLTAPESAFGERVACHDCGTKNRVPAPPKRPVAVVTTADSYDVDESVVESSAEHRRLFDDYAAHAPAGYRKPRSSERERRRRGDWEETPASDLGWGVGLFAGLPRAMTTSSMIRAWLGLTFGMLLTAPSMLMLMSGVAPLGSMMQAVGATLIMTAIVAMTCLYLAVWSSIFWAVLDDAASGAPRVHNWPPPDPNEWALPTFTLAFALVVSAIPGALIAKALGDLTGLPWPLDTTGGWVVTGLVITLPIVLLSQMDTGSIWGVFSPDVARSMWHAPVTWLTAYAALVGLGYGSWWYAQDCVESFGAAAPLAICPVEAAVDLVTAWLLGRLAWIAATATPQKAATDERG